MYYQASEDTVFTTNLDPGFSMKEGNVIYIGVDLSFFNAFIIHDIITVEKISS
jgi:hypothetical protein